MFPSQMNRNPLLSVAGRSDFDSDNNGIILLGAPEEEKKVATFSIAPPDPINDLDNFSEVSLDSGHEQKDTNSNFWQQQHQQQQQYFPHSQDLSATIDPSISYMPQPEPNNISNNSMVDNGNSNSGLNLNLFSQLPTAASTMFSTFSNIIKGSIVSTNTEPEEYQATNYAPPVMQQQPIMDVNPMSYNYSFSQSTNIEPPPNPVFFSPTDISTMTKKSSSQQKTDNTFRLRSTKKTYAHIPGLSGNVNNEIPVMADRNVFEQTSPFLPPQSIENTYSNNNFVQQQSGPFNPISNIVGNTEQVQTAAPPSILQPQNFDSGNDSVKPFEPVKNTFENTEELNPTQSFIASTVQPQNNENVDSFNSEIFQLQTVNNPPLPLPPQNSISQVQNFFNTVNPIVQSENSFENNINFQTVQTDSQVTSTPFDTSNFSNNFFQPLDSAFNNYVQSTRTQIPNEVQEIPKVDSQNESISEITQENSNASDFFTNKNIETSSNVSQLSAASSIARNLDTPIYRPVYCHWFYEFNGIWNPFTMNDSLNIEMSSKTNCDSILTDNGRYEVLLKSLERIPIYYGQKSTIKRCSWFFKKHPNAEISDYTPFDQSISEILEKEYEKTIKDGLNSFEVTLNSTDQVVMKNGEIFYHQNGLEYVVKRGVDDFVIDDGEMRDIDHCILYVFSENSAENLSEVEKLRVKFEELIQSTFPDAYDSAEIGMIEILPIMISSGKIQELKKNITSDNLMKTLIAETAFYMDTNISQDVIENLTTELNTTVSRFIEKNSYEKSFSIISNSFDALYVYDSLIKLNFKINNLFTMGMPDSLLQIKSNIEKSNFKVTNFLLKNDPIFNNIEPIIIKNQNFNVDEITIEESEEFSKFSYLTSEKITQKIVEQLYE